MSIRYMMITRTAALLAAMAIATAAPAAAQSLGDEYRVGVYGFGSYISHRADFSTLPGVGCCGPGFEDGDGFGYGAGIILQMPILTQLALQLRAGYTQIGGELTRAEFIGNALDGEDVVDAFTEHRIAPRLGVISLEPSLTIRPFQLPVSVSVGVAAGYVATRTYRQDERLVAPSGATFIDGTRVRNQSSGTIAGASPLYLATTAGIGYDIPLGRRFVLTPELTAHQQINDIVEDSVWKAHSLRLGASLALRIPKPSAPALTASDGVLAASVRASGVQADGTEMPIVRMNVEEFMSRRLRPLLTYVFFDEGSSTIPSRYHALGRNEARGFSIDGLHDRDVISTYHDMLNIIGRRMTDDPKATIRLVGTNADEGIEKGSTELSRSRAESVRNYLRDVWGIAEKRMRVEARNLPEVASNVADADGPAENRRVEIIADRRSITEPVLTNDTLRISDPPAIRFRTNVNSDAGVAAWKLVATQSGRVLREVDGSGDVPPVIDWSLASESAVMPRTTEPIEYRLDVVDNRGTEISTLVGSIDVEQITLQRKRAERIADREIDRFSLILFDFGRAELGDANRAITEAIRKRITRDATVEITGHTDRVGDAELNRNLSRDRAMSVARALGVGYENARGAGESAMYDNDLPEGRFYCRIVDVVVERVIR